MNHASWLGPLAAHHEATNAGDESPSGSVLAKFSQPGIGLSTRQLSVCLSFADRFPRSKALLDDVECLPQADARNHRDVPETCALEQGGEVAPDARMSSRLEEEACEFCA